MPDQVMPNQFRPIGEPPREVTLGEATLHYIPGLDRIRYQEEVQMGPARWGNVAVVSGEVLLWMDLILLSFVYMSVRDGSWFWVWWVVSQGALGAIIVIAGEVYSHHRA